MMHPGDLLVSLGEQGIARAPAWELYVWYVAAAVALVATAVFSGSEIGLYSLSKVRLRLRTSRNDPRALTLAGWLRQPTYALEGLLILQNIAEFGFSAAVTGILLLYGFSEWARAVITVLVVTPMVLILAEVAPKDLFHTHADRWLYPLVPLYKALFRLLTIIPLLPVVNVLSTVSAKLIGGKKAAAPVGPRTEIVSLFQETTGLLTGTQQDLVQRALRLARISVREVMIPWNRVVAVPASISNEGFRALVRHYNVSRLPVLGRSTTEVLGIVDVLDALAPTAPGIAGGGTAPSTAASGAGGFKVTQHVHPAMTLIAEQPVRSAITLMQRARQTLAVVVDRNGRAIGLVTMKDLVEELVGDLENW